MISLIKNLFKKETAYDRQMKIFKKTYKPYEKDYVIREEKYCHIIPGERYVVTQEMVCWESVHEWNKYPRPGIQIHKVYPGDIVEIEEVYMNGYDSYYFARKPNDNYRFSLKYSEAHYALTPFTKI